MPFTTSMPKNIGLLPSPENNNSNYNSHGRNSSKWGLSSSRGMSTVSTRRGSSSSSYSDRRSSWARRESDVSTMTFKPAPVLEEFTAPVAPSSAFFTDMGLAAHAHAVDDMSCSTLASTKQQHQNDVTEVSSVISTVANTPVADVHTLNDSWTVWEQADEHGRPSVSSLPSPRTSSRDSGEYARMCNEIKSFDTIEGFMELYNGMVPPSAIINKHHMVRGGESVDAYAFFKTGVTPIWEDEAHNDGGMFQFTFKTDFSGRAMDEIWERLLFTILGNGMPNGEAITGIRMADRHPSKITDTPIIAVRIEIWHTAMTHEEDLQLRKDCINCIKQPLSCGGVVSPHRTVRKGRVTTKTAFTFKGHSERNLKAAAPRRGSV